jgi:hypothetical protein
MSTTRKVAIGLGIAGGALLAAWLLTGTRKRKTKEFLAKTAADISKSFQKKSTPSSPDETEATYI